MLKNHPRGLLVAFFSNMGERIGFYTMMAILVLFLQAKFGLSAENAGEVALALQVELRPIESDGLVLEAPCLDQRYRGWQHGIGGPEEQGAMLGREIRDG